jgi:hypothetical protein
VRKDLTKLLDHCLGKSSPKKELLVASLGCLLGSILVLLALQTWMDYRSLQEHEKKGASYVTLNKEVTGGILHNLAHQEKVFHENEVDEISRLPGVLEVGSFTRNHFPVTVNIWPAGKTGLGRAARADLFFESVPDSFLDQKPESWEWEENATVVPIMVPKFYLDLWNFGLAPSRSEYPALSMETASLMPIEIFIGSEKSVIMQGRFVAFSKRINSVLVPRNFLEWANTRFAEEAEQEYFFVWQGDEIVSPPVSLAQLKKMSAMPGKQVQVSAVATPAKKMPIVDMLKHKPATKGPSRLLVKLSQSPTKEFWAGLEKIGCETNREFPQNEWIENAVLILVFGLAGLGSLVSLLSVATFASSFRLLVVQSAEPARNLIHLGFCTKEISGVFIRRFTRRFLFIFSISVAFCVGTRHLFSMLAFKHGLYLPPVLSWETLIGALLYAWIFISINRRVIHKSVSSFA